MPSQSRGREYERYGRSRSRSPRRDRRAKSPHDRPRERNRSSDEDIPRKHRQDRSPSPSRYKRQTSESRRHHDDLNTRRSLENSHRPSRRGDASDSHRTSHRKRIWSRSPSPRPTHSRPRDSRRSERRSPKRSRPSLSPPSASPPRNSKRSSAPLPSQKSAFAGETEFEPSPKDGPAKEKQKPNYNASGLLAAETNTVANTGILLKYNEPPESRLPPASQPWRLYVFKSSDLVDTILLHTRTCWLFGRESQVVDVPIEHPSCSKQHAVLQFRYVEKSVGEFGEKKGGVGLYLIDLESANGTTLNSEAVPQRRFVECKNGDVIKFGESTREYVILLPPKE